MNCYFGFGKLDLPPLNRCTSLEGIVLKKPILKRHVITDESIEGFFN